MPENKNEDFLSEFEEEIGKKTNSTLKKKIIAIVSILIISGGGIYYYLNTIGLSDDLLKNPLFEIPTALFGKKTTQSSTPKQQIPEKTTFLPKKVAKPTKTDTISNKKVAITPITGVTKKIGKNKNAISNTTPPALISNKNSIAKQTKIVTQKNVATVAKSKSINRKYYLQFGTFVLKKSLNTIKNIITKSGLNSIIESSTASITELKVLVGKFQNNKEVEGIIERIESEGIKVKLIKLPTNSFTILINSYFSKKRAQEIKKDLILKGFAARIEAVTKKREVFLLRSKDFFTKNEAKEIETKFNKLNIKPLIKLGR